MIRVVSLTKPQESEWQKIQMSMQTHRMDENVEISSLVAFLTKSP